MPKFTSDLAALGLTLPIACPLATNTPVTPAGVLGTLLGPPVATVATAGKNRPFQNVNNMGLWLKLTSAGAATVQAVFTVYRNGIAYSTISVASAALAAGDYEVELTITSSGAGVGMSGTMAFYLITAGVRTTTAITIAVTGMSFNAMDDFMISLRPAVATLSVTAGSFGAATVS